MAGRLAIGLSVACCTLALAATLSAPPPAAAAGGYCPLGTTCSIESAGSLALTWNADRVGPAAVTLTRRPSPPNGAWVLGYGGSEIKVATPGLTLCLGVAPRPSPGHRYRVGLEACSPRRLQEWTVSGDLRLGSGVVIRSVAHPRMCLTALQPGRTSPRGTRPGVVLGGCDRPGRGAQQQWST